MIRRLLGALALVAALIQTAAYAQMTVSSLNNAPLIGTYTIATLPTCTAVTQGKYAFATDLGGGADTVLCDGTYWKHIRLGAPAAITATSGTVAITPLASAPVQLITNNVSTMVLDVQPAGLYPGYILYIRTTGLVTGTLGVKIGSSTVPILGNTTSMLIYDGTTFQRIQ